MQIVRRLRMRLLARLGVVVLLVAVSAGASAARPEMRLVRTRHYLIHSDLDDAMLFELGTRMDAMYAEYSRHVQNALTVF